MIQSHVDMHALWYEISISFMKINAFTSIMSYMIYSLPIEVFTIMNRLS